MKNKIEDCDFTSDSFYVSRKILQHALSSKPNIFTSQYSFLLGALRFLATELYEIRVFKSKNLYEFNFYDYTKYDYDLTSDS